MAPYYFGLGSRSRPLIGQLSHGFESVPMPLLATNSVVKHSPKCNRAVFLETDLMHYTFLEAALSGHFLPSKEIKYSKQSIVKHRIEVQGARYSSLKLIRPAERN